MNLDYESVKSITKEEFDLKVGFAHVGKRKASNPELERVEDLLEVQRGILSSLDFYMDSLSCQSCGNELGIYDFVQTAIRDAGHSKSLILHTFVGKKYILNEPKRVVCSRCGEYSHKLMKYSCALYGCDPEPTA